MKINTLTILFLVTINSITSKKADEAEVTHTVEFTVKVGDEELKHPIRIGLFGKDAPKTVKNFYTICTEGVQHNGKTISFDNSIFHRVIPNFMI